MKKAFFTIIVVSYNAGHKLVETVDSIKAQTFKDVRILVKDGMSTDGSVEELMAKYQTVSADQGDSEEIILVKGADKGIYDGMNIALTTLKEIGDRSSYVFFLNCGDVFKDEKVLEEVYDRIVSYKREIGGQGRYIFYGDIFERITQQKVSSNPKIDDYACYRNVPSHQACFYDEGLIEKELFDLSYKVRADYEQFLRCFYVDKAEPVYIPVIISIYEGGGYSDQNVEVSENERKEIIAKYLSPDKIRKYDLLRVLTLAKLRTAISSNKATAGVYNKLKSAIYGLKGNKEK